LTHTLRAVARPSMIENALPWLHRKRVLHQHHVVGEPTAALGAARVEVLQWLMANFRELTARIGWSDVELSRRLSVRPGAVRDWRTGRREVPPNLLEWLRIYAEAIDRLPSRPKDWTRS
jgi:hypothetical protein